MARICLRFIHQESYAKKAANHYSERVIEYTIEHPEKPTEQLTDRLITSL